MKNYVLVNSQLKLQQLLDELEQAAVVAYDTETTGLNTRQDKLIGMSFTTKPNTGYYIPILVWNKDLHCLRAVDSGHDWSMLALAIAKKKLLVMHNASFDIRITFNDLGVNLLNSLHADTMLMIHTLQEEGPFALKEFAEQNKVALGFDAQDAANQEQLDLAENVKANGGKWLKSNKEFYKADLDVLSPYAIADTDLTLRIYNFLSERLESEKLTGLFYDDEVMPLYKTTTIRMESKGVHLDMPKLQQYNIEIQEDIRKLQDEVVIALLATPEGEEFAAERLAEEFPPKNSGRFAQEVAKYFDLPLPKNKNGKYSITKKTLSAAGYDSGSRAEQAICFLQVGDFQILFDSEIEEIQKRLLIEQDQTEHIININSKMHLGKIVFDKLGIEPLSRTEKGAGQFNEDFIEHLATEYNFEWAKRLRVYNKLVKIQGSTYQRFLDEQEDGIFYPQFKQHATTSGRYGSDLQQLPRPLEDDSDDPLIVKYTNVIRELIIPKPGYVFIDDDYSSLEPSVFADDSEDQPLMDIFIKGEDFYSKVAIMALGLTDASADKKAPNFLKNLYPQHRQDAKAYSLGIRYGAKAGKVAQLLSIEPEQAEELIKNYFKAFPNLKAKMDGYLREAKRTGKVTSKFGRVRHLPRLKQIYDKFGDDILDYKKLGALAKKHYIKYDDLKQIRKEYNNLLNNALNFPIQSTATSIVSRAAIAITREFSAKKIDGWVSLSVHDQLVISVKEEQKELAAAIVQTCMETTNTLTVPLVAVPQFAYNLRDGH